MKKIIIFCFILIVLFVQNISSQELGDLYTERVARFTMSMPMGWQTADLNMKYLNIIGPEVGGFIPNIGFSDEDFSGSVSEYIDAITGFMPQMFSDFRIINRTSFSTEAGLNGESVTYQGTRGTITIRQKMYIIPNRRRNSVMEITATAPVTGGERYDAIFDTSVRTFNWTR